MSSSILGKTALKRMLTDALRKGPWSDRQIDVMIESLWREHYSMRTSGFAIAGGPDAEMFWNDNTRTFTIQPLDYTGSTTPGIKFAFYTFAYKLHYHKKYLPHTVQLPDEEGLYCIYFDQDDETKEWELTYLKNPTSDQTRNIYLNRVIVAWIYWNYDTQEATYIGDSRHGSEWNPQMHWMLHQTINSRRQSGLALTNVTYDGDGTSNGDYQFGISAGELWHDDIFAETLAVGEADSLPVWYFNAAGDPRFATSAGKKFLNTGSGRVAFNGITGGLAEAPDMSFVAYHLFATNCTLYPHISAMGQASHTTLGAAVGSIEAEVATLRQELPHANLMHIASFVLQTSDGFTNGGKAVIVYTSAAEDVFVSDMDWNAATGDLTLYRSANRPELVQRIDIGNLVINAITNAPDTIVDIVNNIATSIVQNGIGSMKESFLIDDYIGTTYTQLSSWFVVAPNENVGNFKATVMVHDKVDNSIFSLQNTLTFDYKDPLNEVSDDNEIITATPVTLTLGIDSNKQLYATLSGMHVTDNERIHFCFERCANNTQPPLTLTHLTGEGTPHDPTTSVEATVTLDHLEGEGTVHEVTAEEVSPVEDINYGLLYNWYAATDAREISSSDDWVVPEKSDWDSLVSYIGGYFQAAKLKEEGTDHWNDHGYLGTNDYSFNARGAGYRDSDGTFYDFKGTAQFWAKTKLTDGTDRYRNTWINAYEDYIYTDMAGVPRIGFSIRLLKTASTLSHGETGTYTGNDGKVYRTICIGTQEWLADNLAETKYRNDDTIPEVTDDTTWSGLTTGALCAYNNDWNNV